MSSVGKYNPQNLEHNSNLFDYGEVPLASNKLNLWNGNIEAALNFAVEGAIRLLGLAESDYILWSGASETLKVEANTPSNMQIKINPGQAIVAGYFSGLDAIKIFPVGTSFLAPETNPRIDTIYIDTEGIIGVIQGSEAESPSAPSAPANTAALAHIYLRPGMESIKNVDDGSNGYIIDQRPDFILGKTHQHNSDRQPIETPDGNINHFSTEEKFIPNTLQVFVNGILQAKDNTYSEDSNCQGYTFFTPLPSGFIIEHRYLIDAA